MAYTKIKIKSYLLKKILKYPRIFEFLKKYRRVISPPVFSVTVSYEEAANYTKKLAKLIPNNFDVIVGIPRSGLFVADILATKFGRPLTTPDLFIKGEIWGSSLIKTPKKIKRILLVDDSVSSGKSLKKVYNKLIKYDKNLIIKKAALVSHPEGKKLVDYVLSIKKPKCVFEWQIIQGSKFTKISVDMDGVLCEDCPVGISSIEDEYIKWMENAKPFMIPVNKIDTIITSRLEKYRTITEEWLKKNNVKYKNLLMMKLESDYSKTHEKVVSFKINALKSAKPEWFWESNFREAYEINKKVKIPVLCTDEMVLLNKKGDVVKKLK